MPIKSLKVDGGSTQETRSGINKFNLDYIKNSSDFERTATGVNLKSNWASNIFGNPNSEEILNTFKPNTAYTMKAKVKVISKPSTITEHSNRLFILYRQTGHELGTVWTSCLNIEDKETIALNTEKEYITTFTTPADMTDVMFLTYTFHGNNDGSSTGTASGEIDLSDIMLVEGTYTAENFPDFEQYGASPSPEFPNPIKSVGDDGTVVVEQRGKNEFNKEDFKKINANMNNETLNSSNAENCMYFECKPNTTYSFQKTLGVNYKRNSIAETIELPKIGTAIQNRYTDITKNKITYTTSDTAKYIVWWYYCTGSELTEQEILDSMQIEEDTEATDYEPYFRKTYTIPISEPLRSLPSGVKDELKTDGIHRRVGTVILDGSDDENWLAYTNTSVNGYVYYTNAITDCKKALQTSLCSHFKNLERAWNYGTIGDYSDHPTLVNKYFVTDKPTLAAWKQWLSENPIQIDYELAEEVVEPLDEEQLAVIDSIKTNKGTTYFTNADGAEMEIEYYKDLETLFNKAVSE